MKSRIPALFILTSAFWIVNSKEVVEEEIVTVKMKRNPLVGIKPETVKTLLVQGDKKIHKITDEAFVGRTFEKIHRIPRFNLDVFMETAPSGPYAFLDVNGKIIACFMYYPDQQKLISYHAHMEGDKIVRDIGKGDFFNISIGGFSQDIWDYLKQHPEL
jgi:hypothetical protein